MSSSVVSVRISGLGLSIQGKDRLCLFFEYKAIGDNLSVAHRIVAQFYLAEFTHHIFRQLRTRRVDVYDLNFTGSVDFEAYLHQPIQIWLLLLGLWWPIL